MKLKVIPAVVLENKVPVHLQSVKVSTVIIRGTSTTSSSKRIDPLTARVELVSTVGHPHGTKTTDEICTGNYLSLSGLLLLYIEWFFRRCNFPENFSGSGWDTSVIFDFCNVAATMAEQY